MILRGIKFLIFFTSISLIFSLSCDKMTGKPPLSAEKFSIVYTDYILAVDQKEKEKAGAVVDSVFQYHGVKSKDFKETIQYYMKNPKQWEEMMNLISKELEKRSYQLESAKTKEHQATQKPQDPNEAQPILE